MIFFLYKKNRKKIYVGLEIEKNFTPMRRIKLRFELGNRGLHLTIFMFSPSSLDNFQFPLFSSCEFNRFGASRLSIYSTKT